MLDYTTLAERVRLATENLGTTRRLVVLEGRCTVDTVVTYLGALAGGHPVVLVPDADTVACYDPDVVVRGGVMEVRHEGTVHDLHPDLALLMSTSGSTGSPKLVRLSHTNLTANAEAIAGYLGIRASDVAPTTLPLHYCYGLSVLNSHLTVGAAVLLTDEPVTSPAFWEDFSAAGCTTIAGVPYTFDLLDRIGFADLDLPTLRYLTQAGGRLDPDSVRRYAALGQQRGFDLFVMYGATEATARMAYLPPDLALHCAEAIGVPIPGGSFRIDRGELVYRGDNVMLGYATSPADLARGREISELRTGDLARLRPDGLVEITGRTARVAKIFGLRIDLARVERLLSADGCVVHCVEGEDKLVVAIDVSASPAPPDLSRRAASAAGLPEGATRVLPLAGVPRLSNGKPDHAAIVREAAREPREPKGPATDLRALYAEVLRRHKVSEDDSFVSLGGDSLTYVELSIRLEQALGQLPSQWPTMAIRALSAPGRRLHRWGRAVETSVVLRAAAIVIIVASHADLISVMGGAHVLLAVMGFNFGRFFMTPRPRLDRVRRILTSTARIAVPAAVWLGLVVAFDPGVTWRNVLLLNGVIGSREWGDPWQYWFIEAAVYTFLWGAVLAALPWFDRAERRWPFWLPVGLSVLALLTRYDVVGLRDGPEEYRAHVIVWLFLLGWATAKAARTWHRVVVSALVLTTVPGFFDGLDRTVVVISGVLLLVWLPAVRVPSVLAGPTTALAGASLVIYLTHWQVYPWIEDAGYHLLATIASLAVGLAAWWATNQALNIPDSLPGARLRRDAASGIHQPDDQCDEAEVRATSS
jgi:acyl-CoA synthetase (AMP-forming)/AMP-acid ligase II